MAEVGVGVVPVDPAERDRRPVQQQPSAVNLDVAKADGESLNGAASVRCFQKQQQRV